MCFHSIKYFFLPPSSDMLLLLLLLLCCCCQVGLLGDSEDWLMVHQVSNQPEARSLEVPALNPYTHYRSGPLAARQHNYSEEKYRIHIFLVKFISKMATNMFTCAPEEKPSTAEHFGPEHFFCTVIKCNMLQSS